jgi:hypothetical protein
MITAVTSPFNRLDERPVDRGRMITVGGTAFRG